MRHAVSPVTLDVTTLSPGFGPSVARDVMAGWLTRAGAVSI